MAALDSNSMSSLQHEANKPQLTNSCNFTASHQYTYPIYIETSFSIQRKQRCFDPLETCHLLSSICLSSNSSARSLNFLKRKIAHAIFQNTSFLLILVKVEGASVVHGLSCKKREKERERKKKIRKDVRDKARDRGAWKPAQVSMAR